MTEYPSETAFDALRAPSDAVSPDPQFAAALRARVVRALDLPRGVSMSATTLVEPTATATATAPASLAAPGAAIPYLSVRDARRALDWYVEVFGARRVGEPYVMADGSIGHAELALGDGALYLAEGEYPEIGVTAADPAATASSLSLVLRVEGLDRVLADARAAGARVLREPDEGYGARNATIFDPFGTRWMLTEPLATGDTSSAAAGTGAPARYRREQLTTEPPPARYRHGDTAYVSLWVPDVEKAVAFYGAVLGWEFTGDGPGRQVVGTTPPHGLWTVDGPPRMLCCHAVDDLDSALARVRAAGGEADVPEGAPYGRTAMCRDHAGAPFALVQVPPGPDAGDPPRNGVRAGDVSYLTIGVAADTAATRAFFGAVLGWRFDGGDAGMPDGWEVEGTAPMTGMWGGAPYAGTAPMYRVDDIAAAVARVRAAGGTATDPERKPYGLSADCVDDQGASFWLGQH